MGIDLCWAVSASAQELEMAFPVAHHLLYVFFWLLTKGLPLISVIGAIALFWNAIPWKNLALSLLSLITILVISEMMLRLVGCRPGQFTYSLQVQPVDSLYTVEGYVTDEAGIMKLDTGFFKKTYTSGNGLQKMRVWFKSSMEYSILCLFHDVFGSGLLRPTNEFWNTYDSIASAGASDSWSRQYIHYAQTPVNEEGFYSIPFDTLQTDRKSILLLGDSFTWGLAASNWTNSFSNILLSRGYRVYNTGISGADLAQYRGIFDKYVQRLKPDIVILNFYIGNDVCYIERTLSPDTPVLFHTNAGRISSVQNRIQFASKEAAYGNLMNNMLIPQTSKTNRRFSKTVVTTLVWGDLAKRGLVEHKFIVIDPPLAKPMVDYMITPMVELCDSLGIRMIISVIPQLKNGELIDVGSVTGLLENIAYYQPKVTPAMYRNFDVHFNDEGHLFYANYLEKLIDDPH